MGERGVVVDDDDGWGEIGMGPWLTCYSILRSLMDGMNMRGRELIARRRGIRRGLSC